MSLVMLLRQRIKTVETIRKTTHAMRLTSMSTHAVLNKKMKNLEIYRRELERILKLVKRDINPDISSQTDATAIASTEKELIVVVGSQKGLCGAFNTRLFRYFSLQQHPRDTDIGAVVVIGKKMAENLRDTFKILYSFERFDPANFFVVTQELYQHIVGPAGYTKVTIYSNYPQSFFVQRPMSTTIDIPRQTPMTERELEPVDQCDPVETKSGYQYDEPAAAILKQLENLYLKVHLEEILFESLIAEHAARFISMDASTTNAEKILDDTRRDYNKLRQASITRELMDLMSGLL